ncbi:MAG: SDR family oxidoreductase [Alphaproteobacteria bacterium]|nr:SDR family oxidoreductase [Alphaproteobacteria bacterium]MDE2341103.1 SDR family oxidoreductase [Alphaproteobacteria bacterium]
MRRIGAAIAARLAREGWALALHNAHGGDPDPDLTQALMEHSVRWHGFIADLGDEASRAALLPAVAVHFGVLPTLLINNAALFETDDAVSIGAEKLAEHQAVNLNAPVLLATQLARALPAGARACVINILDQRIAQPHGDQLSYTLSKQALAAATQTLARALAPHVRVNAVAPGLTLPTPDYAPDHWAHLATLMPLGALPKPVAIADAVAYLAGAEHTTGQIIFVDGGAHLRAFERDFIHLTRD